MLHILWGISLSVIKYISCLWKIQIQHIKNFTTNLKARRNIHYSHQSKQLTGNCPFQEGALLLCSGHSAGTYEELNAWGISGTSSQSGHLQNQSLDVCWCWYCCYSCWYLGEEKRTYYPWCRSEAPLNYFKSLPWRDSTVSCKMNLCLGK